MIVITPNMKCTDLIKILADNVGIYGDMDIQVMILTDNIDISQDLKWYDWGIFDDKLTLNFEIANVKEFKKQLK